MLGRRYRVKRGDTLWDIARAELGDPREWPRIWRYNNRPEVARYTGRALPDPQLLLAGQLLLLPVLPAPPRAKPRRPAALPDAPPLPSVSRPRPSASLPAVAAAAPLPTALREPAAAPPPPATALPASERPIAIQYGLDLLKLPPILHPEAIFAIRMSGDVVLTTQARYPLLAAVDEQALELRVSQSANQAFGALVREIELGYDTANRRMTCRAMLVARSRTPNAPTTAVGFELSTDTALPVLRFEFRWPRLEGVVDVFTYTATGVTLTIDATARVVPRAPMPEFQRVPEVRPAVDAKLWLGVGLIVTGSVVVLGTLAEDFFSLGVGLIDTPAMLALGGMQFSAGCAVLLGEPSAAARAATQAQLPKAPLPAVVQYRVRIESLGRKGA